MSSILRAEISCQRLELGTERTVSWRRRTSFRYQTCTKTVVLSVSSCWFLNVRLFLLPFFVDVGRHHNILNLAYKPLIPQQRKQQPKNDAEPFRNWKHYNSSDVWNQVDKERHTTNRAQICPLQVENWFLVKETNIKSTVDIQRKETVSLYFAEATK